eukprot:2267633-Rhodomonas_salina.1
MQPFRAEGEEGKEEDGKRDCCDGCTERVVAQDRLIDAKRKSFAYTPILCSFRLVDTRTGIVFAMLVPNHSCNSLGKGCIEGGKQGVATRCPTTGSVKTKKRLAQNSATETLFLPLSIHLEDNSDAIVVGNLENLLRLSKF